MPSQIWYIENIVLHILEYLSDNSKKKSKSVSKKFVYDYFKKNICVLGYTSCVLTTLCLNSVNLNILTMSFFHDPLVWIVDDYPNVLVFDSCTFPENTIDPIYRINVKTERLCIYNNLDEDNSISTFHINWNKFKNLKYIITSDQISINYDSSKWFRKLNRNEIIYLPLAM